MREVVDPARIAALLRALGQAARRPSRIYLTGGGTAVLQGWRASTIDVDLKLVPDDDALLRAIPRLKEDLRINVELASPDDFIPVPAGWEDRSIFIVQHGPVAFFHFDLTAQALSKVERGHARDLEDVRQMLARGLVTASGLRETFELIAPRLYRFPAIDPRAFRERLDALLSDPAVSGGP